MMTRNSNIHKRKSKPKRFHNPTTDKSRSEPSEAKNQRIEIPSGSESEFSGPDILSTLPDGILCLIFSRLDTKSAIKTCLIAKRYRTVWTQLENLNFSSSSSADSFGRVSSSLPRFESQVFSLLMRRNHDINLTSLRLSLHHRATEEFVVNCVDYAVSHNLKHFRIRAHIEDNQVSVPGKLLVSSSLVSLRLSNEAVRGSFRLPMAVHLVGLKELYLKKFEFSSECYDGGLFAGCPSLESLVLHKCWVKPDDKLRVLDLNCPRLRNLEMKHWRTPWRSFNEWLIEVDAPQLVSFKYQGIIVRVVSRERLRCLESVDFEMGYPTACGPSIINERLERTLESFISMLGWLCNAKFMTLSWSAFKVLGNDPDLRIHSPIAFANLKSIKFTAKQMHGEIRIPVQSLRQSLEAVTDGVFHYNVTKEQVQNPEMEDANDEIQGIPANVLHYFLENSPSVESFYFQMYKKSSDEEEWKRISWS